MKTYLAAGAAALALALGSAAQAAVVIEFNPTWGSTENTGAAATATFNFVDLGGDVKVTLDIDNITDSYGGAATQATLMGIAFDLPTFTSISGFNANSTQFTYFKANTSLPPYGSFDRSVAINNNFTGGNPQDGLKAGQSVSGISFVVNTTLNAADFEAAFLSGYKSDGALDAAARFQQVNAGGGSDKVLGGSPPPPPPPPPPTTVVPEPSTWAMMLIGFMGAGAMMRRRKALAAA